MEEIGLPLSLIRLHAIVAREERGLPLTAIEPNLDFLIKPLKDPRRWIHNTTCAEWHPWVHLIECRVVIDVSAEPATTPPSIVASSEEKQG